MSSAPRLGTETVAPGTRLSPGPGRSRGSSVRAATGVSGSLDEKSTRRSSPACDNPKQSTITRARAELGMRSLASLRRCSRPQPATGAANAAVNCNAPSAITARRPRDSTSPRHRCGPLNTTDADHRKVRRSTQPPPFALTGRRRARQSAAARLDRPRDSFVELNRACVRVSMRTRLPGTALLPDNSPDSVRRSSPCRTQERIERINGVVRARQHVILFIATCPSRAMWQPDEWPAALGESCDAHPRLVIPSRLRVHEQPRQRARARSRN